MTRNREVEEVSEILFGSRFVLPVAALVAEQETFYAKQLATLLGISDNLVLGVLRKFEKLHLIRRLPRLPGENVQRYVRTGIRTWRLLADLATGLVRDYGAAARE